MRFQPEAPASVDLSTTQSPLFVNYHPIPNHYEEQNNRPEWYRRSENCISIPIQDVNRQSRAKFTAGRFQPRMKNVSRGRNVSVGRRRSAKPLKVIKRRVTPPGVMSRIGAAGEQLKEWFLEKKRYLVDRRVRRTEGPVSLRAATFVCGLAVTFTSLIGVCYVDQLVSNPAAYVLQIYQCLFGIATVIIEAKNLSMFESLQEWVADWFPFLSTFIGKGGLYIFMGVLGVALWNDNIYVAIAGSFMLLFGLIYFVIHFGLKKHLRHVGLELTQLTGKNLQDEYESNSEQQENRNDNYDEEYPTEYLNGVYQAHRERFLNHSMDDGGTDQNISGNVRFELPSFYGTNDTDERPLPPRYHQYHLAGP